MELGSDRADKGRHRGAVCTSEAEALKCRKWGRAAERGRGDRAGSLRARVLRVCRCSRCSCGCPRDCRRPAATRPRGACALAAGRGRCRAADAEVCRSHSSPERSASARWRRLSCWALSGGCGQGHAVGEHMGTKGPGKPHGGGGAGGPPGAQSTSRRQDAVWWGRSPHDAGSGHAAEPGLGARCCLRFGLSRGTVGPLCPPEQGEMPRRMWLRINTRALTKAPTAEDSS